MYNYTLSAGLRLIERSLRQVSVIREIRGMATLYSSQIIHTRNCLPQAQKRWRGHKAPHCSTWGEENGGANVQQESVAGKSYEFPEACGSLESA